MNAMTTPDNTQVTAWVQPGPACWRPRVWDTLMGVDARPRAVLRYVTDGPVDAMQMRPTSAALRYGTVDLLIEERPD
jgi:hypothetical protein